MIATSVVPPPMSTTMLPLGRSMGRLAPIAAAMGSSIRRMLFMPTCMHASKTAFFSTWVIPDGTPTTIFGLDTRFFCRTTVRKYLIMALVTSKSAMTPSFIGRMAAICCGVFPMKSFASLPTAISLPVFRSMATTEGSLSTMPSPFI